MTASAQPRLDYGFAKAHGVLLQARGDGALRCRRKSCGTVKIKNTFSCCFAIYTRLDPQGMGCAGSRWHTF